MLHIKLTQFFLVCVVVVVFLVVVFSLFFGGGEGIKIYYCKSNIRDLTESSKLNLDIW